MQYAYRSWILIALSGILLWCSSALGFDHPVLSTLCVVSGLISTIISIKYFEKSLSIEKSNILRFLVYSITILYPILYHISLKSNHSELPPFTSLVDIGNIDFSGLELLLWSILGFSLCINLSKFSYKDYNSNEYVTIFKSLLTYTVILLIIEFVFLFSYKVLLVFQFQPDFTRLTDYSTTQYHIVGALFMILLSTFIVAHHLTSIIQYYVPNLLRRMGVWTITILSFGFLHMYLDGGIEYLHFVLGTSSFVILLDLYTESKQRSFTWILIWLMIVTGLFTTIFISKQQELFKHQISNFELSGKIAPNIPKNIHLAITKDDDISIISGLFKDIGLFQFHEGERQWTYEQYIIKKKKINRNNIYFALPTSGFESSINLFTIFFTLGFCFLLLIGITNGLFRYLPESYYISFDVRKSMKNRLQITLIGTILFAFIVIGFTTVYFIDLQQTKANNNRFVKEGHLLISKYTQSSNNIQELTNSFNSNLLGYQIELNESESATLTSNDPISYIYDSIDPTVLTVLIGRVSVNNNNYIYQLRNDHSSPDYSTSSSSVLNTLIKVYVFLFLLAYAITALITSSITWPLISLSDKLKNTTLGGTDQEIEWPNEDEIGQLIQNYNVMLRKLNQSANLLARNEREMAWREMAKQVAHEIKNPLTPMKLSIQYLQHASNAGTHNMDEMIKKVSHTLIEQIDNLTRIATEFSNFAKMPNAQNEKVVLNEVVVSVHNLFRKREDMDIQCYLPIDEIYVFADKDHLIRIMNNLIKNAIQAIPTDRPGEIIIRLQKTDRRATISLKDNGIGIPESMKDKIFEPNFTTKSSGTGLGLAMCANMINGFNGDIYFKPNEDIGTTFYVEIPMMRLDDNFKTEERVSLE